MAITTRTSSTSTLGVQFQVAAGVCVLVALALGLTLYATTPLITRRSMDLAAEDVAAARAAFARLMASRVKAASSQLRLITLLPVFRAHMTSADLRNDAATLNAMVEEYRLQLGARFAVLTDRAGTWQAQPGWAADRPAPDVMRAGIAAALERQSSGGLAVVGDELYLVVSEPVTFGDEALGTLSVGVALDDSMAREMAELTHSEIGFVAGGRLSGSSLDADEQALLLAHLNASKQDQLGTVSRVTLGPDRGTFVTGIYPLDAGREAGWRADGGRLILLRDWRRTQVFLDQMQGQILQSGVAVLIVALVAGIAFSSRVTRPFRDVSAAAERLAAGDWSDVPVRGGSEAATIASAFNAMGRRLRETYERLQERTHTLEREVMERQRVENKLIVAKSTAEQASVAKSAFLANMSHELRTPLNAILGYAELLQEQAADRGDTDYLPDIDHISSAGRHLLALIGGVLDLSRIEAGRMELDVEEIDAGALVKDVLATIQPLAREHRNRLTAEGLDQLGTIQSDETKLRQVLFNVVGNACKFTSDGQVLVSARRARAHEDTIIINVTDSGIGMTREQMGRLFGDYSQADGSTTRRFGGAGLGLAISHRLCALMGGTISVKSESGRGSTFTITMPANAAATPSSVGAVCAISRAS